MMLFHKVEEVFDGPVALVDIDPKRFVDVFTQQLAEFSLVHKAFVKFIGQWQGHLSQLGGDVNHRANPVNATNLMTKMVERLGF
jgi:hypothetical protein